jgi:hypothetical protein
MSDDQKPAPCPFCGASPHYNLSKGYRCQSTGELLHDHIFSCPHGCAQKSGGSRDAALRGWNARTPRAEAAEARVKELEGVLAKIHRIDGDDYVGRIARAALSTAPKQGEE